MKSHLLITILLGAVLAVTANQKPDHESLLRAFEISCKDCNTLQYGDTASSNPPTEFACPAGTLCGPVNGAFNCVPEADAADCSCGDQVNTYIPEPYDNTKYIACLPGGEQATITCESGKVFTGDFANPCDVGPSCTSSASVGFNAKTPECNQYFFCEKNDGSITENIPTWECPDGQVFDTTMFGCKDPCTLAPEPFECQPTDSGPFPDPEDCTIFHICFNGAKIGDPIACPEDSYFDKENGDCSGTDDSVCTQDPNECYLHYKDQC